MQNLLKSLTANYKAEVKSMKKQVKKDLKQAQKQVNPYKGTIYLCGIPSIDTPEAIECFRKMKQADIKNRLIELQKGYWQQGDGRVSISVLNLTPDSILIKTNLSDCDWHYAVRLKKATWDAIK